MPTAAVIIERIRQAHTEPHVLVVRRAVDPGRGGWDLPAGYLDPGESFEMAARREAREEVGMEVELIALVGVYHSPAANAVSAVFRGRPLDAAPEVRLDFESSDHAWVPRSDIMRWLPRVAFPSMASALADWAASEASDGSPAAPV